MHSYKIVYVSSHNTRCVLCVCHKAHSNFCYCLIYIYVCVCQKKKGKKRKSRHVHITIWKVKVSVRFRAELTYTHTHTFPILVVHREKVYVAQRAHDKWNGNGKQWALSNQQKQQQQQLLSNKSKMNVSCELRLKHVFHSFLAYLPSELARAHSCYFCAFDKFSFISHPNDGALRMMSVFALTSFTMSTRMEFSLPLVRFLFARIFICSVHLFFCILCVFYIKFSTTHSIQFNRSYLSGCLPACLYACLFVFMLLEKKSSGWNGSWWKWVNELLPMLLFNLCLTLESLHTNISYF